MGKTSLKFKLSTRLFFALLAIFAASLVAYNSVSNLVKTLSEESKPNQKMVLLSEIISDLSDAESSVRTFSITYDTAYLSPFQRTVSSVEEKMEQLQRLNNDSAQKERLDSIDILIKKK